MRPRNTRQSPGSNTSQARMLQNSGCKSHSQEVLNGASALAVHHWVTFCRTARWVSVCYAVYTMLIKKARVRPSETSQDKCAILRSGGLHRCWQGHGTRPHPSAPFGTGPMNGVQYDANHLCLNTEEMKRVTGAKPKLTKNNNRCATCTEKLSETDDVRLGSEDINHLPHRTARARRQ